MRRARPIKSNATPAGETHDMRVIGVDCATDDSKVGIALGVCEAGNLRVLRVEICSRERHAAIVAAEWLAGASEGLVAIDAPLGWPTSLVAALANHSAGSAITIAPNDMFRRETDRFVQRTIGKTPLDVGADRIARTAHAALDMLHKLRKKTGNEIRLAWNPGSVLQVEAIEVYPAATLSVYGFRSSGYKEAPQGPAREEIVRQLGGVLTLPADTSRMLVSGDALDAVVCLLAARDFLDGTAMPPEHVVLAQREGWIWVAPPKERTSHLRALQGHVGGRDHHSIPHVDSPVDDQGAVIDDVDGLTAADVAGKRVRCPACGEKVFASWPLGWDRHAEIGCTGLRGNNSEERKTEFKRRCRHLFR